MSILIEFPSDEDCLAAIRVFRERDEGYYGLPSGRIVVTKRAVDALKESGVQFRIVGKEAVEIDRGTDSRL